MSSAGAKAVVVASLAGFIATVMMPTDASARGRGHRHHARRAHVQHATGYSPPFSAMVVDANTGKTMYAVDVDEPRHPASVTKVMTLYLLFEQLERGALSLDSDLTVSARAAAMAPSKLYLKPGDTISVEDAIKAVVTKSANDVAAAIAENVGGSEEAFAEKMTRKARQLGMSGTTYRNASGLPNPGQITTARDLTILGRAIQEKFPRYYRYFQTRSFMFAGHAIGNHNRLIGRVEGVDGIKTGFTNASGFNLLTSARLDGRHVVGVILGGRSGASRDAQMATLIRGNLPRAYAGAPTSSVFADAGERVPAPLEEKAEIRVAAKARFADVDTTATLEQPPVRTARAAESGAMRAVVASAPGGSATTPTSSRKPLGAQYASAAPELPPAATIPLPPASTQKIDARLPASAAVPPRPEPPVREATVAKVAERGAKAESKAEPEARIESRRENAKSSPWVIQLAASQDESEARAILTDARQKSGRALVDARPFTEKIVRGSATLFRARFSGFDEPDEAQDACKSLKRSGFSCFATRS